MFQNAKSRIHLSGDVRLRTDIINTVCKNAPKEVMDQFAKLERTKRKEKNLKLISRKRASELLHASPAKKRKAQGTLPFHKDEMSDDEVDSEWALAFFGLDIAPHKISHPLFRSAIATTKRSKRKYKGSSRQKLFGPVLTRLHATYLYEQKAFLTQNTGFGRAITGDSATIMGTKYMNFLVHDYGKGVMLVNIRDCTTRLVEVGSIESTYIAHHMMNAIK